MSRVGRVQVNGGQGRAGRGHGRRSGRTGSERAQEGGDDTVGHRVELGNGGTHGGRQLPVLLLVALRPDAAQAVEGNHSDKEFLRQRRRERVKHPQ